MANLSKYKDFIEKDVLYVATISHKKSDCLAPLLIEWHQLKNASKTYEY